MREDDSSLLYFEEDSFNLMPCGAEEGMLTLIVKSVVVGRALGFRVLIVGETSFIKFFYVLVDVADFLALRDGLHSIAVLLRWRFLQE